MMKKLCILMGVVSMMLMAASAIAATGDPVVGQHGARIIDIKYNSFGIAISQTTTNTTEITTISDLYFWDKDGDGLYDAAKGDILLMREEILDAEGKGTGEYKYYYIGPDGDDADTSPDKIYVDTVTTLVGGASSTTYQTTVQYFSWQAGALRLSSVTSNSQTWMSAAGGAPILISESSTVDSYTYDVNGDLADVTGSGWYKSYSTFVDAAGTQIRYMSGMGSISKSFEIRDGQALLRSTSSSGDIFAFDATDVNPDSNTVDVGDSYSVDSTAANEWVYKGGQWLPTTSHSETLQISHAAHNASYRAPNIGLGDTMDTIRDKVKAANSDNDPTNDISYVSHAAKTTRYTYNDNGVMTGMSVSYVGMSNPIDFRTAANWSISVTGLNEGNPAYQVYVLDTDNSNTTCAFDTQRGWYLSDEHQVWKLVTDPDWDKGTWGDPAASGTVFQGDDGKWYMNVQVWSNADKTEYKNITIELNLDALSPESRAALVGVLQQYADSGKLLTLYGFSANDVLAQGAKLVVMGLGKGDFAAHPFDFTGEQPANFRPATEDYAQFIAAMQDSPYWDNVFGGLSADTRATTLQELYNALTTGGLKIGGSFTTSTGVTFRLVAENIAKNKDGTGGSVCRLDGNSGNGWNPMRHFTNKLSKELGLL